ncbi:MAG: MnmC family methyltransferase, partial [Bacteroidota bacterium]
WNNEVTVDQFRLLRINRSVFDVDFPVQYDLVYFDAFGFRAQEEMWGPEVFLKMASALKPGGVLVTYSSKGEVRRRMQAAGLQVEKLAGPAGKREMVRAIKPV